MEFSVTILKIKKKINQLAMFGKLKIANQKEKCLLENKLPKKLK